MNEPLVQRAVVFKFERAQAVSYAFNRIRLAVSEVVSRIDIPSIAGTRMMRLANAIQRRVPHIDVGMGHVDLGPQDVATLVKFSGTHTGK